MLRRRRPENNGFNLIAETIVEDFAVDDGGVLVEDSDVDERGASTHT